MELIFLMACCCMFGWPVFVIFGLMLENVKKKDKGLDVPYWYYRDW